MFHSTCPSLSTMLNHPVKIYLLLDIGGFPLCVCIKSAGKIITTFCKFGKAFGSRTNMNKTEGVMLGCLKNHENNDLQIKWVKSTKNIGIFFGHGDLHSLNWIQINAQNEWDLIKVALIII